MAFADYDNDGLVEILINNQNEPPSLLHNREAVEPHNHWITLRLEGVRANRSAIGAQVRVTAGSLVQTAEVRSGGSYLSQSDLRMHFGLGPESKIDKVEITWPGGSRQIETGLAVDGVASIREKPAQER